MGALILISYSSVALFTFQRSFSSGPHVLSGSSSCRCQDPEFFLFGKGCGQRKGRLFPSSSLTGAGRQPRSPDSGTRPLCSVFLRPIQSDYGSFRKKEGDIIHLLPGMWNVAVTLKPLLCCVQILSPGLALGRRFKVKPSEGEVSF